DVFSKRPVHISISVYFSYETKTYSTEIEPQKGTKKHKN
ncbi:Unannotated, partial [Lentimonas sp. CC19]